MIDLKGFNYICKLYILQWTFKLARSILIDIRFYMMCYKYYQSICLQYYLYILRIGNSKPLITFVNVYYELQKSLLRIVYVIRSICVKICYIDTVMDNRYSCLFVNLSCKYLLYTNSRNFMVCTMYVCLFIKGSLICCMKKFLHNYHFEYENLIIKQTYYIVRGVSRRSPTGGGE